jgi:hypothetical protein
MIVLLEFFIVISRFVVGLESSFNEIPISSDKISVAEETLDEEAEIKC